MVTGYIFGLLLLMCIHLFAREIVRNGRRLATLALGRHAAVSSASVFPSVSASLLRLEKGNIALYSADELCDELLMHMLDCDLCLAKGECSCSDYRFLRWQITAQGGPHTGLIFAI